MPDTDGGELSFKATMDGDQLNSAIEESIRRIQMLSDGTASAGDNMQSSMEETGRKIEETFQAIDQATDIHKAALAGLEAEYARVNNALTGGVGALSANEYKSLMQQKEALSGEIATRKGLISELDVQAKALAKVEAEYDKNKAKVEKAATSHQRFTTQLRLARDELIKMELAGQRGTAAYADMQKKVGALQDAIDDASQQARVLANDEAQFQGIITGLSGIAGGFSAATGAVSLFADKNEDLQLVMAKVQSAMSIAIGMQQVAQTLNKDSAFRIVTLGNLQSWWAGVKEKANLVQKVENVDLAANTVAKEANTVATGTNAASQIENAAATGAQSVAAETGTVANTGLAGAFRLVGAAIKSIPVFGWIIAGISGLIGLYSIFSARARAARKEQEEFSKALIEGSYKPIGAIEQLSVSYNRLGDDMAAKKKFVEDNQKAFDALGVSVKDVADAQNLLINNKDAFIRAQIEKARASVIAQQANDKLKKSLELQAQIDATPDTITNRASGGYGGANFQVGTFTNPAKVRLIQERAELENEIKNMFEGASNAEEKGMKLLNDAGLNAAKDFEAGTVGAIEQAIQAQNTALQNLKDPKEIAANLAETKRLQKQLDSMLGRKEKVKKTDDPVIKQIEDRKKAFDDYNKWVNAGMEKEAKVEFDWLLKSAKTYKDYLEKLLANGNLSHKQVIAARNELAEANSTNLLGDFKQTLDAQMNSADSVIAKLNAIASLRQTLTGDGTSLDTGKSAALDEAQKKAIAEASADLKKAQNEYTDYLNSKIDADLQYFQKREALQKQFDQASDPVIKQTIQSQIQTLDISRQLSEQTNYDELLNQFRNYQQQREAISKDFDAKIALATKNSNAGLTAELENAKKEALNKIDMEEIQKSPEYTELFSNLDTLAVSKIIEIRNKLEAEWAKLDLPADQLAAIREQLERATDAIRQRNPFAALGDAWKRLKESGFDIKSLGFSDLAKSATAAMEGIEQSVTSVLNGLSKIGIEADESTQQVINDVMGLAKGVAQIASGNPVQAIQGVISVVSSGIDLVFGAKDRKAQRAIATHAEAVKKLEDAYNSLKRAIDKSLGSAVYDNQKAAIDNMRQQQDQLQAMIKAEEGKKKTDQGKIDEWKKELESLSNDIEDTISGIANDVLQTNAKSLSDTLGDALVEAFGKGEDAAKSFEQVANDVLKNAIINQLKKNFLEKQVQDALDRLYKDMGGADENFSWDGLTDAERAAFKNEITNIGNQFDKQLSMYSDLFKDVTAPETDTSLTGAVKGVTEETASLLAGQINAIRISQAENGETLRQSLLSLSRIAENTSYNRFLQSIDARLEKMANQNDPLRGKGITG